MSCLTNFTVALQFHGLRIADVSSFWMIDEIRHYTFWPLVGERYGDVSPVIAEGMLSLSILNAERVMLRPGPAVAQHVRVTK